MSIFYFSIGALVIGIQKLAGRVPDQKSEQEIRELGMLTLFRTIGLVALVVFLYKVLEKLNLF